MPNWVKLKHTLRGQYCLGIILISELRPDRVKITVADSDPVFLRHPDPDPGKYRIRILYPLKTHVIQIFSFYKIV